MKVLHINCNYIYTWLHQQMAEELAKIGVENRIVAPVVKGAKGVVKVNDNVAVLPCFQKWDKVSFYYKQKKIISAVKKCVEGERFDLLHAYTLFTDGNVAYRLSKETGVPYVVAIRNTDVNAFLKIRPYLRGRAIRILRGASRIFFLSDSYQKRVFDSYIPEKFHRELLEKTVVIPNGIASVWHEESCASKKMETELVSVVCAGLVNHNKNYLNTARACEILINKGRKVEFHAVGKIGDQGVLDKLVSYDFATYHTPRDPKGLMELYQDKSIFVMPSFQESFGLVYAEAMSQGLPVIYSKGEGFDGQFPEGEVGFGVNPYDPKEIALRIEDILKDYDRISQNCLKNAGQFSWADIAGKYEHIYREILEK